MLCHVRYKFHTNCVPTILHLSHPLPSSLRRRRRKDHLPHRILLHHNLDRLLPTFSIPPILLRDPLLQRIIRRRLNQQIPHSLQHGPDLGTRLPVLRLQQSQAHITQRIVGNVWVVDARDELDDGGFEGVVGGQREEQAKGAWGVGGGGGRGERDVPWVDGFAGGERDCEVLGGGLGYFGEFLGAC